MKRVILFLLVFYSFRNEIFSQKSNSGLYVNSNDYIHDKMNPTLNCDKDKILGEKFFNSGTFQIKMDCHKKSFHKKDYYSFKNCDHISYRFYNSKNYEIVDTASFIIYKSLQSVKTDKGFETGVMYSFSKTVSDEILDLTKQNLEEAYSGNSKFRYELDHYFKNDHELLAYDRYLKTYKLKHLFQLAAK